MSPLSRGLGVFAITLLPMHGHPDPKICISLSILKLLTTAFIRKINQTIVNYHDIAARASQLIAGLL
jgi:hypothetical protein